METSNDLPRLNRSFHRERLSIGSWWKSGDPWIWLTAMSVGISVVAVLGILALLAFRGLAHFWPSDVMLIRIASNDSEQQLMGELHEREVISARQYQEANPLVQIPPDSTVARILLKTGNRKVNPPDFRWVFEHNIKTKEYPKDAVVIERTEWGHAYGYLDAIYEHGSPIETKSRWLQFQTLIANTHSLREEVDAKQKNEINRINYRIEQLRLEGRRRELDGNFEVSDLEAERLQLHAQYQDIAASLDSINKELDRFEISFKLADGTTNRIGLSEIIQAWRPNQMSILEKLGLYFSNLWNFLTDDPREANTEGGIYPALFGTVLMVLLMSLFVTPFGVVAAVYLREYAKQGPLVQLIRIAVNNLAGVPSIVYGVFGLGFFVYLVGGSIDTLFFPEAKPAPTFGTPGLIWASLTLAILTVPVVIVSTEEGLTRIPREIREGSLALGATKAETIFRMILPMASPSILTGMILAVARAAGEVAPLMLVGVVKLAPSLPIDGNFPYLHLERKFMHLGFHIYDVGFQSPNVDAARPLVYATAMLLVVIIVVLNLTAITLRNRLERRYRISTA